MLLIIVFIEWIDSELRDQFDRLKTDGRAILFWILCEQREIAWEIVNLEMVFE